MTTEQIHMALPVEGYTSQSDTNVKLSNRNKKVEELILKIIDELSNMNFVDKRWLATGKTDIEKGFMSVNRSIFNPSRAKLVDTDVINVNSLEIKVGIQGDTDEIQK